MLYILTHTHTMYAILSGNAAIQPCRHVVLCPMALSIHCYIAHSPIAL